LWEFEIPQDPRKRPILRSSITILSSNFLNHDFRQIVYYYVLEGGTLRVYPENGQSFDAEEPRGSVEWGDHIGKHYVENIGTTTVKLLVTEVKAAKY
jgi:hypothetical protein